MHQARARAVEMRLAEVQVGCRGHRSALMCFVFTLLDTKTNSVQDIAELFQRR
jgi:hypothetical protein